MRVIAGRFRSRKLNAPPGISTRPTHDRVKEALFSILGDVHDTKVLDLFAGTGALGIEALSRGARHACFVEQSKCALDCIRRNLESLNLLGECTILGRSVESSGDDLVRLGPHDLVFCDPPWANLQQVAKTLGGLSAHQWLHSDSLFVLEHPAKLAAIPLAISGLVASDQRSWGDTGVTFYRLATEGRNDDT